MPNNISVAVSADVTDLQVKFAVAKAETSGLTTEMNKLARQSAQGIIDPAGQARLQEVAGDLIKARAEAASLGAEFKEMTQQTASVGGALEEMQAKLNTAFQVTGVAAGVEALRTFSEMIESFGEKTNEIRTTSDVLGVTGEQFQAMEHAAEEVGVGMETLTRAAEKMNVTLFEAREGSSAAIEKMLALGVTTQQLQDPTFKVNDLLETLHIRLTDASTAQSTMNELMKDLGPRAALAAEAIKRYDGSAQGVKEVMSAINGVTDEQTKKVSEGVAVWKEWGTTIFNGAMKATVALANMMPHTTGSNDPALKAMETEQDEARQNAQEQQDMSKRLLQTEMENAKAGVAAYKEGSQQKLDQLQAYATAAAKYYGSDSVDVVVKANQEIIAAQRALTEQQTASAQKQKSQLQELTDFGKQLNDEILIDRQRLALESAKITADQVKEEKKEAQELYEGWQQTYTQINEKHAQLLKQENADTAKAVQQDSKAWQGVVGEIEGAESSMVSNILTKRKSLTQSLVEESGQLVTKEIANDLRAVTTRLLLQTSAANSQKALEQGGLVYHLFASNAATATTVQQQAVQTSATASSQAAQTGAVVAGNAARTASTDAAAASSLATSAAVGSKTVMQDAAKAFSGVYASVAQIPYVGWILAPIAASAAFAGVAAYEGLASLDTGTNYVPQDQIAQIHEGEAVIPKQFNPFANPGMAMAGGGYSEEHNYHGNVYAQSLDAVSLKRMLNRPGGRDSVVGSAMRKFRRGAR